MLFLNFQQYDCLVSKQLPDDREIFMPFGSLHTIENLSYWSNQEDEIFNVLKLRREYIMQEIDLISRYPSKVFV